MNPSDGLEERPFDSERLTGRRLAIHRFIFGADTPQAKFFDEALIVIILASVGTVMLESVDSIGSRFNFFLICIEWGFTVIFTVEYALRLICVGRPLLYARSFYGIVDLLAVLPTYLGLLLPGAHALLAIRLLRILRVFRILKLMQFLTEANYLLGALRASRRKITIFILTVLALVTILGSLIYVIEAQKRICQYSAECILGYCHANYGRVRRHIPTYAHGAGLGRCNHDHWLRHNSRTYWYHHGRVRAVT